MGKSHIYAMLITSLPSHPKVLFAAKQTPISRLQLDRRLALLDPQDARDLPLIENVMHWDYITMDSTDEELIAQAQDTFKQLNNEFIQKLMFWRLELRTNVAALRRRQLGMPVPGRKEKWGYGRWIEKINKNWSEPGFGLERFFPWILKADQLIRDGNSMGLERLLLGLVWDNYGREVSGHYFDFEAVVVYVLRWHIIDRWSRYDGLAAKKRFDQLVGAGMGDFADIFS